MILWIDFLYAALNNLEILSYDISNTYIKAPCGEKLWTVAGKEFRIISDILMKIQRALYSLKSAGNSWHRTLSMTLRNTDFESSHADTDIWLRLSSNSRGEKYREWIVVYVDDLLAISENPKAIMDSFSMYDLKDTVRPPTRYLGANVGEWQFKMAHNAGG